MPSRAASFPDVRVYDGLLLGDLLGWKKRTGKKSQKKKAAATATKSSLARGGGGGEGNEEDKRAGQVDNEARRLQFGKEGMFGTALNMLLSFFSNFK